jgi:hypothetical protein
MRHIFGILSQNPDGGAVQQVTFFLDSNNLFENIKALILP